MSVFKPSDPCQSPSSVPELSGSDIWTPRRIELLNWFRHEAPSLAEAYEGSVRIMYTPDFPAKAHFVCHVVRDIYSKLPEILDGKYRRNNFNEVKEDLEQVKVHWKPPSQLLDQGVSNTEEVRISSIAAAAVDGLLKKYEKVNGQDSSAKILERALRSRMEQPGSQASQRLIDLFAKQSKWFTKRAHLFLDVSKAPSETEVMKHFNAFEITLHSLVGGFFTGTEELDDLLREANQ